MRRPAVPPRARSTPTVSKICVSLPAPVEASEDDVPEVPEPVFPEPPEAVDAEVTGAIVVVVAGSVDVVAPVDVVDVVVELEVVVEEEVVVVVVEGVGSSPDVAVQQVLKVCAVPGATALTPGPSVEVE
jgi:hypothetical protein